MSVMSDFHLYLQENKNLSPEQIDELTPEEDEKHFGEYIDECFPDIIVEG